jgi:hypothetical protein
MLNVYVPMVRSHETVHTFTKPSTTLLMILFDPPKRFSIEFDPFLAGLVIRYYSFKFFTLENLSFPLENLSFILKYSSFILEDSYFT